MQVFFVLVAMLALIVELASIVMYFVSRAQHNIPKRKKWRNIFLGSIAAFVICCIGSGLAGRSDAGGDTHHANHAQIVEDRKKAKLKSEKKKQSARKASIAKKQSKAKKKPKFTKNEERKMAVAILKYDYRGVAKVWYDSKDKMFMIQPTSDEFKEELLDMIASGKKKEWHKLTKSIDAVSRSVYEKVGLTDAVSLANPEKSSKVLYSSVDGVKTYDFMDGQ